MTSLCRPSAARIAAFAAAQAEASLTYPEVGATRGALPCGYRVDRAEFELGQGPAVFERAKRALRGLRHYDGPARIQMVGERPELTEGSVINLLACHLGIWTLSACRVVYVFDEPRAFGFAYGTLEHAVRGEERFEVLLDETDRVLFRLLAFSKPAQLLVRLAGPLTKRFQRQGGEAYAGALRRAIAE